MYIKKHFKKNTHTVIAMEVVDLSQGKLVQTSVLLNVTLLRNK